ncbi:MAG: MaoC family dehydratase [Rhodospirillales bacterium]|nr:MaoC family dehydratase [Rhodospirillales bacterium]
MSSANPAYKPKYHAFEDMKVGQINEYGAYKVTAEEIIEFASKYDPQPFHLDHEAAKHSLFGGLCASGWHTCAMTMSMMVADMMENGSSLGSPGVENLRWVKPVYPGDTLSVRMEILETRISESRPEIGIIKAKTTTLNQKGEVVQEFISRGMFPRMEAEASN